MNRWPNASANSITTLEMCAEWRDQLWYVAHPVHPTEEEIAAWRKRLTSPVSGSFVGDPTILDPARLVILDNITNAKRWLGWLIRRYPPITFIAPWIASLDGGGDDDLVPEHRARGLRDCRRTIRVCSGMVHVGGRVSSGMLEEASQAHVVVDLTYLGRSPPTDSPEVKP